MNVPRGSDPIDCTFFVVIIALVAGITGFAIGLSVAELLHG